MTNGLLYGLAAIAYFGRIRLGIAVMLIAAALLPFLLYWQISAGRGRAALDQELNQIRSRRWALSREAGSGPTPATTDPAPPASPESPS
jgi:hypothetical protein